MNCSVLGNIQDSSLKELLYKEITEGNAWLRIRGNENLVTNVLIGIYVPLSLIMSW